MDDIMVVEFFRLNQIAEAEPEAVQEIDLVGGEIWSVRTENFEYLVPGGHVNFKIELRLGITEALPGFADLAGLLFALPLTGGTGDDRGRLQALSSSQNTVPEIV